jgi:hypothetical protein
MAPNFKVGDNVVVRNTEKRGLYTSVIKTLGASDVRPDAVWIYEITYENGSLRWVNESDIFLNSKALTSIDISKSYLSVDMLLDEKSEMRACEKALDWFIDTFDLSDKYGHNIPLSDVLEKCPYMRWIQWLYEERPSLFQNKEDNVVVMKGSGLIGTIIKFDGDSNSYEIKLEIHTMAEEEITIKASVFDFLKISDWFKSHPAKYEVGDIVEGRDRKQYLIKSNIKTCHINGKAQWHYRTLRFMKEEHWICEEEIYKIIIKSENIPDIIMKDMWIRDKKPSEIKYSVGHSVMMLGSNMTGTVKEFIDNKYLVKYDVYNLMMYVPECNVVDIQQWKKEVPSKFKEGDIVFVDQYSYKILSSWADTKNGMVSWKYNIKSEKGSVISTMWEDIMTAKETTCDSNSKIKLELHKIDKAICCRILSMDERFRNKTHYISGDVPMAVKSVTAPSLGKDVIHLRGIKKDCDQDWMFKSFNNNEERDKYISDMILSLKEWAKNWEGFEEIPKKEIHHDVTVASVVQLIKI